jgi:hypothetical protein
MGIALLSLADLFMPLQSLADRWMPSRRSRSSGLRYVGIRPSCASRAGAAALAHVPAPARPLRVVRTVDAQRPGQNAGRVVISGRMADVCAELDRLAALEATGTMPRAGHLH